MIALLLFSVLAALTVWFAGRKDPALDPRLTTVVLVLLGVLPVLVAVLPKAIIIHQPEDGASSATWKMWLIGIWSAGFLVEMVRLLLAWNHVRKWRTRSEAVDSADGIEIRMLDGLRGPVAAGVFQKVVYVPAGWAGWSDDLRNMALAHELAHHRRRDPLRRWIAGVAVAVNWFNPLVRWMVARLLIQCEYSCDAVVLKNGTERRKYAKSLCDLAEEIPVRGPALAMAARSGLESRVSRILRPEEKERDDFSGVLILLAIAAAGMLAVIGEETYAGYTRSEIEKRRTADPFPVR